MNADYSEYDFKKSIDRIDNILQGADSSYDEKGSIPSRDSLTFDNGYYVKCSALFIDIRDSKNLNNSHTKPVLSKIYKSYISELIAVLKGHSKVNEIYIEGDSVWGIFDTPYTEDIDELFEVSASATSLINILNKKLRSKGYSELKIGIGMSYGSSLLIKSGYKGSGINEVVWLGSLVSEAALLCSYGNKDIGDSETMISETFYCNLKEKYQNFMIYSSKRQCYHGHIVNSQMNDWLNGQA